MDNEAVDLMIEPDFALWANSLPYGAREIALRYPPARYVIDTNGVQQTCVPLSYSEDGTCRVQILAAESEGGVFSSDYEVFGIDPRGFIG